MPPPDPARNPREDLRRTAALLLALLLASSGCDGATAEHEFDYEYSTGTHASTGDAPAQFQVPPPPFQEEGIFPCSDCHDPDIPVNRKRRELKLAHTEIVFHHDEENRWCLDCHDAEDRDMLHLANGKLIPFEESYKLCGQCHGDKYRDWREGIHGRRKGQWNGEKEYLLCVACHNSHDPAFKARHPYAPPTQPEPTP